MSTGAVPNPDGTFTISSCDFGVEVGQSYIVFAIGKSLEKAKAHGCTSTNNLRHGADTLLYLDKLATRRGPR